MTGAERLIVRLVADATEYNRVFNAAESRLMTFVSMVTTATIAAGKAAIQLAADWQDATVSFQTMLGSAEAGTEMMEKLQALAIATPFQTGELVESARRLAAYGVEAKNILPTIKALGEFAAASGGGAQKLDRLALAYGQVLTAGRLMGTELRQFAEAGIGADVFAKEMGLSVREFRQLVEAGEVGSAVVTKALNSMTAEGGKFHGMMEKMSQTARGQFNAMKESAQRALKDLGLQILEALQESGLLTYFRQVFDEIRNNGPAIKSFFVGLFESIKVGLVFLREFGNGILEIFIAILTPLGLFDKDLNSIKATAADIFEIFVRVPYYIIDGLTLLKIGFNSIFFVIVLGLEAIVKVVNWIIEKVSDVSEFVGLGKIHGFETAEGFLTTLRGMIGDEIKADALGLGKGADAAAKRFRDRLKEAGVAAKDVRDALKDIGEIVVPEGIIPADLMKFLDEVRKDFKEHGNPFRLFERRRGALEAAMGFDILGFKGVGAMIGQDVGAFGMMKIFEDLKNTIKDRLESKLPQAMLKGSVEAQDIINKQQFKQTTVQEEILKVLQLAKAAQEDVAKKAAEIRDLLKKAEDGGFIRGGF